VVDDDIMNRMIMSTKLTQVLYYARTYYAHSHTMRTHILCALMLHMACTILIAPYHTHTARILHSYHTQAQYVHIL
jgi:hypothetical protein